ncbi:MAG: SPOR domain-containing protein [Deltaproteobacteria bacterium]|nr:SPOR domain-containing protein [Deltaproteobacteria bacterium]
MKDSNHERPEKDASEEVPVFSDGDLEDYLRVEEEYSGGGEIPKEEDPSPQILASLKRQGRSKRSLIFVALLCLGMGIVVLAIFFFMKPEVRKPRIVAKRMKHPIPPVERKTEPTVSPLLGKKEGEKPSTSEPSMTIRERGTDKKVIILGGKELLKEEKEVEVPEREGITPGTKEKEEGKPQVAMVEEPKVRAIPEQKLPVGRFTINVASFRKKVRAERFMEKLKKKGYKAFVAEASIPKRGTWYRVSVGRFPSRREAEALARTFKEKEGLDSFVRELKEKER